jgi:hypothetical protein
MARVGMSEARTSGGMSSSSVSSLPSSAGSARSGSERGSSTIGRRPRATMAAAVTVARPPRIEASTVHGASVRALETRPASS